MLGGIEFKATTNLTKLPQKVATALATLENPELVGAGYKGLMYVGKQVVKGVNYWFIAEQTLITRDAEKHIVKVAVNDFKGKMEIAAGSIETIF